MVELLSEAKGGAATAQPGSARRVVWGRGLALTGRSRGPDFQCRFHFTT